LLHEFLKRSCCKRREPGLFSYAGKAAKAADWPTNPDIPTGILLPLMTIGVWPGLRRQHKNIHVLRNI
jgi:uncharacterized membrane-anchored protein